MVAVPILPQIRFACSPKGLVPSTLPLITLHSQLSVVVLALLVKIFLVSVLPPFFCAAVPLSHYFRVHYIPPLTYSCCNHAYLRLICTTVVGVQLAVSLFKPSVCNHPAITSRFCNHPDYTSRFCPSARGVSAIGLV